MPSYKFLVFTNPNDGQDEAFNQWYDEQHVPDVLKVPGMVAAQRFKLADPGTGELAGFQYLAIYEVETDDPAKVLDDLTSRAGTDQMVMSDSMNPESAAMSLFKAIAPRATAGDTA
jgi:hypothetical protein